MEVYSVNFLDERFEYPLLREFGEAYDGGAYARYLIFSLRRTFGATNHQYKRRDILLFRRCDWLSAKQFLEI